MNTRTKTIRILIVDDHKMIRQGLRMLIENHSHLQVAGETGDCGQALSMARSLKPDIILLDLDMGGSSGLDILHQLLECGGRVIILTGVKDSEIHLKAVRMGTLGLVMKDEAAEMLIRAIESVHDGEAWLNHRMTAKAITRISQPERNNKISNGISELTPQEKEILAAVCEGMKNREIAERLFISEATVRNHLTSIFSKFDLSDRFELAIYCYRHGLAEPPSPPKSWTHPDAPGAPRYFRNCSGG